MRSVHGGLRAAKSGPGARLAATQKSPDRSRSGDCRLTFLPTTARTYARAAAVTTGFRPWPRCLACHRGL